MNTPTSSLSELFVFPFRGKDWAIHLLVAIALSVLGALLLFIPTLFVLGYLARLMRRVIAGGAPELPAWYDWGNLFTSGLKVTAAGLIYTLPSLLLFGISYAALMAPTFTPFFTRSGQVEDTLALLLVGGSFAGLCLMGAGLLVWLATAVLMPVAVTHLIAEDSFAAAFRLGRWWRLLRANLGGFMVSFLLMLGLFMLMYFLYSILFLTIFLCFLAPLVAVVFSVYQLLVGGALYADAYREAASRLAGVPAIQAEASPSTLAAGEKFIH